LVEALLVLAVLSLGLTERKPPEKVRPNLVSVTMRPAEEKAPEKAAARPNPAKQAIQQPRQLAQPVPQPLAPKPAIKPPAVIVPTTNPLAALDISKLARSPSGPPAPGRGPMGPANFAVAGDSKRVGSAPNGQPMYAASWYREPYDDELQGYLSTADGPGWALIACRTVPNFRVDDCVGLDEYPAGSRILRAVLAAAWQFEVRPPRVGGISQVGSWVRIRIDYIQRKK
jgi:protein TonB